MKSILMLLAWAWASVPVFGCELRLTSPNGGELLIAGTNVAITWSSSGMAGRTVRLVLFRDGVRVGTIAAGVPDSGRFSWTVGEHAGGRAAEGGGYRIRVREHVDGECLDESDQPFRIAAMTLAERPHIAVSGAMKRPPGAQAMPPHDIRITRVRCRGRRDQPDVLQVTLQNDGPELNAPRLQVRIRCDQPQSLALDRTVGFENLTWAPGVRVFELPMEWPISHCSLPFTVEADPGHLLPDWNRANNAFSGAVYMAEDACLDLPPDKPREMDIRYRSGQGFGHYANGSTLTIRAGDVAYDPMFQVAYVEVAVAIRNCGPEAGDATVELTYLTHDNPPMRRRTIPVHLEPGRQGGILEKLALKIRDDNFIQAVIPGNLFTGNRQTVIRVDVAFRGDFD